MAEFTLEFHNVQRITAGAIGKPGQRVFYLQVREGRRRLALIAEKEQVRALADALDTMLEELAEQNPLLASSDDLLISDMSLEEPLEAEYRVAQMGLGYDAERDMVVLVVQGSNAEDTMIARIAASRPQMRALSTHAARVVAAGRPVCGNCGRPIEPSGHFCPERNGHGPASPPELSTI